MKEVLDQQLLQKYVKEFQLDSFFSSPSLGAFRLYEISKGETICTKGDSLSTMYLLVKGKVKIFTTTLEGKSLILRFKTPFAIIGDVEYVKQTEVFNTVESVSDGYLIGLPFHDIKKHEAHNHAFLQFLLEIITHKFYTESHASTVNMLYPVDVRLASYLLSLSKEGEGSLFHEEMRTSILQDIADVIGTSYRHLNRVLQDFHQHNIIERTRGMIIIKDVETLKKRANGNIYE
ncbi:Crp/Fnr family transcriptional regulator [Pontibacillus salicampi]|uniref:Crp/Fnr family transcriptional regulator n=1 Tax=Pontibacillus salicampi TaxID=1449801 RepID=A0ABV6LK63_9BACI